MKQNEGKIIIAPGVNVWPHELKTAEALSAAGYTVEFIRRSEEHRARSADCIIGGIVWEMKAPTASNMKAVEKNLRKALNQASYVIFDCRRMKGIPDTAIEREVRTCVDSRVRGLKRVLFVSRKGRVIDIS
ncbi:MAG: hypothetical protein ACI4B9_06280 [Eggerthellaceae bacterium]